MGIKLTYYWSYAVSSSNICAKPLYIHALEHLEAARPGKKMGGVSSCYGPCLLLNSLKACAWSGHIFGASASPKFLKKKLDIPLFHCLFMAVSLIPSMWHPSCYIRSMRHSWLTKFGVLCWNQLVNSFQYNRAVGATPCGKRCMNLSQINPAKPLQYILEESLHWAHFFLTATRTRKCTICCVCIPWSCACIFVILHPLTRKTTLRRSSCVTVRWWLASVWGWHCCRQSSTLNKTSVARELVRFQVGGVLFVAFVPEAFFGLKNASNWFVSRTKKIAVNVICLQSKVDYRGVADMVREVRRFP